MSGARWVSCPWSAWPASTLQEVVKQNCKFVLNSTREFVDLLDAAETHLDSEAFATDVDKLYPSLDQEFCIFAVAMEVEVLLQ